MSTKPTAPKAAAATTAKVVENLNPQKATERDTPVLIPDSVDPATETAPASLKTEVVEVSQAPALTPVIKVEVAPTPALVAKGNTVKVEFLRSHPAFGHFVGDKAEISQEDFDKYSQDGPFFKKL